MFRFPRLLILFVALLIVAGCEDNGGMWVTHTPDGATALPTDWPTIEHMTNTPPPFVTNTPTEAPVWDTSCIAGVDPINPVVCPADYQTVVFDGVSQQIPQTMALRVEYNPQATTNNVPEADIVAGAMRLNVSQFAGDYCLQIHNIYMEANHCYTYNVPLSFNFRGATNFENFWYGSTIYSTNGSIAVLDNRPAIEVQGDQGIMVGTRPDSVYWTFRPASTQEVVWEMCYHATWPTTGAFNYVDFEAFYIQDQFNTNLCN